MDDERVDEPIEPEPSTSGESPAEGEQLPVPSLGGIETGGDVVVPFHRPEDDSTREGSRVPAPVQEFFIPIHGFVRLTAEELTVVNHPAFQRLGEIYQLGQTHLVYRGATHRRFEHSLGTLHVVQMMVDSLTRNATGGKEEPARWRLDTPLKGPEVVFVRLGALLHDLGHLPAGHTFEDELGLFQKHDSEERLKDILKRTTWFGDAVQSLEALIDERYAEWAHASGLGLSPTEILLLLVAKGRDYDRRPSDERFFEKPFRVQVCRDLIGNTICADLLDYLHRDLHHLGKPKHFDMRLFDYMEIRREEPESGGKLPADSGQHSRFVMYLRADDRVRTDAASAILDLLEARYHIFEMALYHRRKLSATAMLERAVSEIADAQRRSKKWLEELIHELLECSDTEMLTLLARSGVEYAGSVSSRRERLEPALQMLRDLRVRRLYKTFFQAFDFQLQSHTQEVQALYGPTGAAETAGALPTPVVNRLQALRALERDFGLDPLSLVMYCPPGEMSTKIARVQILINDEVHPLDDYEGADPSVADSRLTGGHLAAQKKRFGRLWRVSLACRPDVYAALKESGRLATLRRAVDCLVLGQGSSGNTREETAHAIARELAMDPDSPIGGSQIIPASAIAARHRRGDEYPTGLPTLREMVV